MKPITHRPAQRRRDFLTAAAVAPLLFPSSARGANDRVQFALIGAGGRGRGVASRFIELGAPCTAVCDIYEPNLAKGVEMAGDRTATYGDFRHVLDRKDVYCEKPMTHSIAEGVRAIREVRATDRIVQIGMQRRSTPWIIEAKKLVDDGIIGEIYMAKAQWNWVRSAPLNNSPLESKVDWNAFLGSAPKRPLEPQRFRSWRYFWDYSGGNMTDQGTHLMDVIQWFTNAGTPRSAVCQGRVFGMTGSEVPDAFAAAFEYSTMLATWTLNYNNDYEDGWTIRLEGNNGTLVLDGSGYRIYAEPWKDNREPVKQYEGPMPTMPHVRNFVDCVKSRTEPNAPVEVGHSAVCGPHLANVAFHTRRTAYLNPGATAVY